MGRLKKIADILYYVLKRPEVVLETIQGQIVSANELGGGRMRYLGQGVSAIHSIYLWEMILI